MTEFIRSELPESGKIEDYKKFFSENDKETFNWTKKLREEVEPLSKWKEIKQVAAEEIEGLDPDVTLKLLERFKPYIKEAKAGHSQGHVYRDLINIVIVLKNDPSLKEIDYVEKTVGLFGAVFHDIGNSVVDRYQESKRFSGHAEVGAALFDKISKDLIPPNLRKLVCYAIAAHTHYTRDIEVVKDGETVTKKPYEDEIIDENRWGVWLTRWTDRVDIQGMQGMARHMLTKATPTEDYSQEGFHQVKEDEKEDFIHHFTPFERTDDQIKNTDRKDQARNVLEHMRMFRNSALTKNIYSQYDTQYFTNEVILPAVVEQLEFVDAILRKDPISDPVLLVKYMEDFFSFCRQMESGPDVDMAIEAIKNKFSLLSEEEKGKWARGFSLIPNLHEKWYRRILLSLSKPGAQEGRKLDQIIEKSSEEAVRKLSSFAPKK